LVRFNTLISAILFQSSDSSSSASNAVDPSQVTGWDVVAAAAVVALAYPVAVILGLLMVKPMVENIAAGLLMTLRPHSQSATRSRRMTTAAR
jgi:ABC-type glycerol-3-phosphate transport system permease component